MARYNQNTVLIASLVGLSSLISQSAFAEEQTQSSQDKPSVSTTYFNSAPQQSANAIQHFNTLSPRGFQTQENTENRSVSTPNSFRHSQTIIAQNYDDIWGVVATNPQFSILQSAIASVALSQSLRSDQNYTLLAPTDAAFDRLPQGTVNVLLQPQHRDLLTEILTYHIIPGELTADEIQTGTINSLNGGIAIRVTENNRIIANNGSVVNANIPASNGVIHSVNQVLMPQGLRSRVLEVVRQDERP